MPACERKRGGNTQTAYSKVYMYFFERSTTNCKVQSKACRLPLPKYPALLPSESLPRRGEWVAAIGSQFGVCNLVTLGNVCGIWDPGDVERILFTAPVSGGNSGCPLINASGRFVGIVTGTYDKGQNMNIAATFESAVKLYKTLKLN